MIGDMAGVIFFGALGLSVLILVSSACAIAIIKARKDK